MELVYLWVEEYKNIKRQGFNFSPRFRCEYDKEKKELNIIDKEETGESYPKNFFGENINITAIVGENGSGKSGIVEKISMREKVFFSHNDTYEVINISPVNFYRNYHLEILNLAINKRNTSYFEYKFLPNSFTFKLEKEFLISNLIDFDESLVSEEREEDERLILDRDDIKVFEGYLQKAREESIKNIKEKKDFTLFLYLSYFTYIIQNKEEFDYYHNYEEKNSNKTELGDFIGFVFDIIHRHRYVENFVQELIELVKNKRLEESINIIKNLTSDIINRDSFTIIKFNKDKHKELKQLLNSLNFLELEFSLIKEKKLILFDNLSTGEQDLLKIYAILFEKIKKQDLNIICLDEVNVFWHPNWQKNFIKEVVDFFITLFYNTKINIILATHSPFILSDIPKDNVIFLEKGKQVHPFECGQTFGANIHTLLSHGFFMKDGLMGEFAKSKIERIKRFYDFTTKYKDRIFSKEKTHLRIEKYYKSNKKEFDYIASIIGETFLQKVIKNYLDELEEIFDKENYNQKKLKMLVEEFGEDTVRKFLDND